MSNEWGLACRDCNTFLDLEWNHGGDFVQQLVPYLADIAKMEPVEGILCYRFTTQLFPCGLIDFAVAHHAHDVIARDEYGAYYGDCYKDYNCPCCGSRQHCRRPKGHEGPCGPKISETAL